MDHSKILEHLAVKPAQRAVDLADRLDRDTDDVEAALCALVTVGDVAAANSTGPNGKPAVVYSLSPAFVASACYEPLAAKAAAANFRAPGWPTMTNAEKAIAFVTARGNATTAELHVVLGLAPDQYVSNYLSSAVRTNQLVKDGKTWTLGPGPGGPATVVDGVPSFTAGAAPLPDAPASPRSASSAPLPSVVGELMAAAEARAADPAPAAGGALVAEAQAARAEEAPMLPAEDYLAEPARPSGVMASIVALAAAAADLNAAAAAEESARSATARAAVEKRHDARRAKLHGAAPNVGPAAPVQVPQPAVAAQVSTQAIPSAPHAIFRFGMWSDGTLEVRQGSLPVLELPGEWVDVLTVFLARVGVRGAA
jgi:hypothetical protein